ncbi:hypothetical protein ACWGM0_01900 [Sphingomonas bisphenolicum]
MRAKLLMLPVMMLAGQAGAQMPSLTPDQEKALAKEIGERVATDKVNCIRQSPLLKLTVISDDVLVYRAGGKRFVSRTIGTCHGLMKGGKPIIGIDKPRICAGDMIVVEDLASGIRTGTCAMGGFATYDRPEKADKPD